MTLHSPLVRRGVLGTLLLAALAAARPAAAQQGYVQTNLVTDNQAFLASAGFAPAAFTDHNLINPWGISESPAGPFWVSNAGTNTSTLYNTAGAPQALVVSVPSPTGQVFNSTSGFVIGTAPATFLFAGLNGTISGWNPGSGTQAVTGVTAPGAVYTGLALANTGTGNFLYAANVRGSVDVYNSSFQKVTLAGSFSDPALAAGLTPYNVQNVGGLLYVAYTTPRGSTTPGGAVDVFDANGNLLRRLSGGTLNQPWGVTLAPTSFGQYGGDLLVGNFGGGQINAFSSTSGQYLGTLTDANDKPLADDGLWGLTFGNGGNGGDKNTLYFAAGIGSEQHGLFGSIRPAAVPEPGTYALLGVGLIPLAVLARRRRRVA